MIHSYINKSYLNHITPSEIKQPRERYKQYVYDLYKLYGDTVTEETFFEGGQHTYEEMINAISQNIENFSNYDLVIFSNWVQEFDPDYAEYFYYYLYKNNLKFNTFDISDRGTLSPILALNIINKFQKMKKSEKSLLYVLEQTTVPRNIQHYDLIPTKNGMGVLSIESSYTNIKNSLKILTIGFLYEAEILSKGLNIFDILQKVISEFNITENEICLFTSKASISFKSLRFFKPTFGYSNSILEKYLDNRYGCLPFFECIDQLLNTQTESRYSFVFLEDAESADLAYLFLERIT